ncbi:MAG: NAD(P)-dependent oxidoreductase [Gemmatimonadales bacterium]|nr:MAG: NAD(P)-dependent oxidoreductase [Gemmatimonadales bacterium]
MRIGFLGLGSIGRPMASHLVDHDLIVWNRTTSVARAFAAQHGAEWADTPRALAHRVDAAITCLPTSAEVAEVLWGPDGLAEGLAPDSLVVDCTSGDPASSRQIAQELAGRGISFVDAPVSGGTNGAEAGTLTVMVGGTDEAFARAAVILSAFASRVEHIGPVGAGHALKAVNQALLATNILALGEGLAALVKVGVPAARAVQVLNASSGRSFVSERLIPDRVLSGAWPATFRLALLDKDTSIALAVLEEAGVRGPVLHRVSELLHHARNELGEEADYLEAIKLNEREVGVEIRE